MQRYLVALTFTSEFFLEALAQGIPGVVDVEASSELAATTTALSLYGLTGTELVSIEALSVVATTVAPIKTQLLMEQSRQLFLRYCQWQTLTEAEYLVFAKCMLELMRWEKQQRAQGKKG
jgi:hypothetical protein